MSEPDLDHLLILCDAADEAKAKTAAGGPVGVYSQSLDNLADAADPDVVRWLISRARDAGRYEVVLRELDEENTDPRDADEHMQRWQRMAAEALNPTEVMPFENAIAGKDAGHATSGQEILDAVSDLPPISDEQLAETIRELGGDDD